MSDRPFHRVVLLCDAACDIRLAVAEAAALARRWDAPLHGVFLDDENLHRFAALPFSQPVSLSSADLTADMGAAAMANLAASLSAAMRRALAEIAGDQGLQWTFGHIRDLPAAAALTADEGDILVVEAAARAFSGAWGPLAAWAKSPAAFAGTTLLRGRGPGTKGVLVLLPDDPAAREKVLAAAAALAKGHEEITLAGSAAALAQSGASFGAQGKKHIKTLTLFGPAPLRRLPGGRKPALVVLHDDAAGAMLDALAVGGVRADILLVR